MVKKWIPGQLGGMKENDCGEWVSENDYDALAKSHDELDAEYDALALEHDALAADLTSMQMAYEAAHEQAHQMRERAIAAEARLAEAERDAARYRWLRDNGFLNGWDARGTIFSASNDEISRSIDARIASETVSPVEGE
jgi:hypothetical protein